MTDSFFHYFTENTMEDYILALGYLVLTVVIFFVLERIIIRKILGSSKEKEDQRRLQAFAKGLEKFISLPLMLIVGIWFGSRILTLPPILTTSIEFVAVGVAAYYLLQGAFVILDYSLLVTKKKTGQEHIVNFFRFILRMILLIIVILWFLDSLGVNITTFLAGFGILGLGFAFALQNVIADLFASFAIYLDRPFEIGDTIKVGNDVGTVEKIGLKSTHLKTPLGNQLIISNRELSNQRIHNMKRMEKRQVELILGVDVNTPHDKLEQIPEMIKDIVQEFENTEFVYAYFTEFGDFTLKYKVIYRITTRDVMVWLKNQQSINLAILNKFEEEGIELPYPIQKVIVENR